jgi:xanthine dehydrogenase molybdenum-binding subunit
MSNFKTVGKSERKLDARGKVTGQTIYVDDLQMPGMLYGKIVRCYEHAHARVKKLDLSRAADYPGVIKVLGPEDVTHKEYNNSVIPLMVPEEMQQVLGDIDDQKIFTKHVKHYGDAIAGIIATSAEIAEQAAEKVIVEYEPLPVYLTAEESKQPGAVQFVDEKPGNLAFELPEPVFPDNALGWGDVDEAFKEADFILEDEFYTPKQKQCQMEPNTYIALYDEEESLHCWTSTQMPKSVQRTLSKLFNIPMHKFKLHTAAIGGGFGARLGMILEPEVCAMALAVPGRHIKLQSPREEDWLTSPSRHPGRYWMKIGFKNDGTPVACDAKFVSYKGAYYLDGSGVAYTTGGWLSGMYKWGTLRYKGETYFTNQPICGAFRGYGNPQTNFAMEQLVDRACNKLGIDPVEWRKRWHKDVGDDGWCAGVPISSCALDECLDRGAEAIGWKEKRAKYAQQSGVKRRGVGVGVMTHTSGASPMLLEHTVSTVKLNEDATAVVTLACTDMGQGSHTTLRQVAAETLGFPFEDVYMNVGDMDAAGYDIGAHASRTLYVGGGSVKAACEDAKRQLFERAAGILEANPDDLVMEDKNIFVKGSPDKSIAAEEITKAGVYNFLNPETGGRDKEPGQIQGYSSYFPAHNSPPFGACFAEVEVNTETGEVKILEAVNATDIGKAINPAIAEGQLDGGAHQGFGFALTEEMYFDKDGKCLNNSFTDYKMLGASDMPKMTDILVENPDPYGPFGAKSVGEGGLVSPIGAIANAIYNAIGVQITEAPITAEKIVKALAKV